MSDIFIKKEKKITKQELENMIPKNSTNQPDINLRNNMVEWRWRIIKINDKTYTEISKLIPNESRLYVNKYNKWEIQNEDELDKIYKEFVFKQYYYYSN